jgi:type IV pilus assembly protein PilA
MNANFKAKFLQNFVSKKKGNEGFTLIELLVVIIIVGVLAAIALPSFLNQIGKARGSEAKSNIGTINRSQQTYRLEKNTFTGALTNLDAKISGRFYSYQVGAATATGVSVGAALAPGTVDVKTFAGAVAQPAATDFFGQVICESTSNAGTIPTPTAPLVTGVAGTCANGSVVN